MVTVLLCFESQGDQITPSTAEVIQKWDFSIDCERVTFLVELSLYDINL